MENSNSDTSRGHPSPPPDDRHNTASDQAQASSTTNINAEQSASSPPAASQTAHPHDPPSTTLWENFMASFRNVVHGSPPRQSTAETASAPANSSSEQTQRAQTTQDARPASATAGSNNAQSDTQSNTLPRPPVYFRMPFNGPDGNPALLAFHPQPLPGASSPPQQPESQPLPSNTQTNVHPAGQPGANAAGTSAAPHSHPHADGHVPVAPLFVPFGASPLPFSFIYDANTQIAWPIAQVTPGSPPGGPSPDAPESQQPRLVAGPPFRIILDVHFTAPPEPERPDPQKAATYVKQLERADVELRARMARLGMGSIGGFGGDGEQDALLGCGICLESYSSEDRPEWIDGPKSQDEAVVAVPCLGHHTLHAGCLRDWLEKLPPSQWTCPFCRASLDPDTAHRKQAQDASSRSAPKSTATSSTPAAHTTLRDEVRARERKRGWRCDAPACFPRYPLTSQPDDGHLELPETSDDMTTDLVKLAPCHHEVHLDCLCTSMRVENHLAGADHLDAFLSGASDNDESSDTDGLLASNVVQSQEVELRQVQSDTVGKWVTCPACRKECWAELPLRRRPQRAAAADAPTSTASVVSDNVEVLTKHAASAIEGDCTTLQESQSGIDGNADAVDPDEEAAVDALLVSN
ncbi:uncharacterized protein SPSC_00644 [Sporisorium scitamineum]|uniref:RING-type domain-containing protein n=1 Tax=Sporisorium scitamineum TaxID=49012 RepID=A0A0F7S2L3_9BASI|nr:uncharacterized protein SPSC_00644 [Sporisorium scitamineum]CDW96348.1 hypothetical protein [Sporisorium scitamineum]